MTERRRRKSLGIFRSRADAPPPLPSITPVVGQSIDEKDAEGKKTTTSRPQSLPKAHRTSMLGSLRSLASLDDGHKAGVGESKTIGLSEDGGLRFQDLFGQSVLHSGEVISGSALFRKRTLYMVLTESYLLGFRSQAKASDLFPTLPVPLKRNTTLSRSTTSMSSYSDVQQAVQADVISGVRLDQVVATYKLDDGKPYFTIEVAYLEERSHQASLMQIQLSDLKQTDYWLVAILSASLTARARMETEMMPHTIEYITGFVERQLDYDPNRFTVFKVVQRAIQRHLGRTSTEDMAKLHSIPCFLAIGLNKIHLIPLPRQTDRSSSTSLSDSDQSLSFGLVTLTSISLTAGENSLLLEFRMPFQDSFVLQIASFDSEKIVSCLQMSVEYLRPEWLRQPIMLSMPNRKDDEDSLNNSQSGDDDNFERTLIAHCAAYDVDTSRICYTIDLVCEDAPCFRLLPSAGKSYNALELLAVFRALRYNETFHSISFAHVDLKPLRMSLDHPDADPDNLVTRSGTFISIEGDDELPVLLREIRGLALKSNRLRRLDFTQSLSRSPGEPGGCGIPEALAPLCKRGVTNVDWLVLNGIQLAESDIEYLVDLASDRRSHARAIELADCGISVRDADVLLSTLAIQEQTIEVINIAGAQGRFSPELFQPQINCFGGIRRLDLTLIQKSAGTEPLIAPETLMRWHLEELYLSQTAINKKAIESIAAYLASPMSKGLRELHLNQTGITGRDIAELCQSMTIDRMESREMHLSVSENKMKIGCSPLFKAIAEDRCPTYLTMRMMDFERDRHFQELIDAVRTNTVLRKLDISRPSFPVPAEDETWKSIKRMFAENDTLEELDISSEHAHLDNSKFSTGLNHALDGLVNNKSLKVLRIEHQELGTGIESLVRLLEKNTGLLELHCDHNGLALDDFGLLVDALRNNTTLLYMPDMDSDRGRAFETMLREYQEPIQNESTLPVKRGSIRKNLTGGLASRAHRLSFRRSNTHNMPVKATKLDITDASAKFHARWDYHITRMRKYLDRNYKLAQGIPWEEGDEHILDQDGSVVSASLTTAMANASIEPTSTTRSTPGRFWVDGVDEKAPVERRPPVAFTLPDED